MNKRLIVYFTNQGNSFINIPCDEIKSDDNFLYGYLNGNLVAMFMIGTFDSAYLNEVKV